MLAIPALALSGFGSQQTPAQSSTQSDSLLAILLPALNEPSLLEVSKDKSVVSYRVTYLAIPLWQLVAIRLTVNADGTGGITSAVSLNPSDLKNVKNVKRNKNTVSAADVRKFLQFIDDSGFWSMTTLENTDLSPTDSSGHKTYVMDGSWCMVEGVRDGSFHYVLRRNPMRPSPFLRIGHYLAKDLANLDGIFLTSSRVFSQQK